MKVNEEVEIVGFVDTRKTTVTGVEMFRKLLDQGQAGGQRGLFAPRHRQGGMWSEVRFWQRRAR